MGSMFVGSRASIGVMDGSIYEATASVVVASCLISNSGSALIPVAVRIVAVGGKSYLMRRVRVAGGGSDDATGGRRIALSAGERLVASCPVAGIASAIVTLYKDE